MQIFVKAKQGDVDTLKSVDFQEVIRGRNDNLFINNQLLRQTPSFGKKELLYLTL